MPDLLGAFMRLLRFGLNELTYRKCRKVRLLRRRCKVVVIVHLQRLVAASLRYGEVRNLSLMHQSRVGVTQTINPLLNHRW